MIVTRYVLHFIFCFTYKASISAKLILFQDRPAKRQKSKSSSTTPAPQNTKPVKPTFQLLSALNGTIFDPATKNLPKTSSSTGTSVKPPKALSNKYLRDLFKDLQAPRAVKVSKGVSKKAVEPRHVSRQIDNSIRPSSPELHDRLQSYCVTNGGTSATPASIQSKRPTTTKQVDVIELDIDSDNNASIRVKKKLPEHLPSSSIPTGYVQPTFVLPKETKPIRFDTQSAQSASANSAESKPVQSTTQPNNVPARAPSIQIPPRHHPPQVQSNIQHLQKPLVNLDRTTLAQRQEVKATVAPARIGIRIDVPPTPSQKASKRKELLTKLKESTDYAKASVDNINEVFGSSGFSKVYDTHSNQKPLQKAAQPKRKGKVDRDQVFLDFDKLGLESPVVTTTDKTAVRHPRKQALDISRERFNQQNHLAPLTFKNGREKRQLDGKFQFVGHYILSKPALKKKQQLIFPARQCQCADTKCEVDCACSRHVVDDNSGKRVDSIQIYHRRADGLVVLTDKFIDHWYKTVDILECTQDCSCGDDCINRVAQKGRSLPLEIFETKKCGFGVRSTKDIVKGQFIDVYLGEVLIDEEINKREAAAEEDTPSYVMTLDNFITDPQAMFYVDGANFGSVMRFVNHSCNPNCKTYEVVMSGGSKHLYHVGFYAVKDIKANTELTIDYDPKAILEEMDEAEQLELDDEIVRCQCGEPNCRKRLWAEGKGKQRRRRRLVKTHDE